MATKKVQKKWAEHLRDYLKEENPQMYKDLKKAGELEQFLYDRENRALDQETELMEAGETLPQISEF